MLFRIAVVVALLGIACHTSTAGAAEAPSAVHFRAKHVDLDLDIMSKDGDWVIGDKNPDEVVTLSAESAGKAFDRDIFVVNRGRLVLSGIQGEACSIKGNIYLRDEAALEIRNSRLTWFDPAKVDFRVLAAVDKASVLIDQNSFVDLGGVAFFFMYGACHFAVTGGSEVKGSAECVLGYDSVGKLDSSFGTFETYGGEKTRWTFRHLQPSGKKPAQVFYWMRFTKGVTGVIKDLPDISADQTHVTGDVNTGEARAHFEDVNVQSWALHSNPGSDVTVDLSASPEKGKKAKFAAGIQVGAESKGALPKLETRAINTVDLSEALGDRGLRIVDTYLYTCQIWANLPKPGEIRLSPGSVIGEGACGQKTTCVGSNVCFDGTGGMFVVSGNGVAKLGEGSRFGRQEIPWGIAVRIQGDGQLLLEHGSFQTPNSSLTVGNQGSATLADSFKENWDKVVVKDSGRVRALWLASPSENALVSGKVDVTGVAASSTASGSDLKHWVLTCAAKDGKSSATLAEGDSGSLAKRALGAWDTTPLGAGAYVLTLNATDSLGTYSIARTVTVGAAATK